MGVGIKALASTVAEEKTQVNKYFPYSDFISFYDVADHELHLEECLLLA